MSLKVTAHAIGRYRERFPAHALWWDAEIVSRIWWLGGRAVEVGNGPGCRYLRADGVTLVACGRRVVTCLPAAWSLPGNGAAAAPRRPKGFKPVRPGRLRPAGQADAR